MLTCDIRPTTREWVHAGARAARWPSQHFIGQLNQVMVQSCCICCPLGGQEPKTVIRLSFQVQTSKRPLESKGNIGSVSTGPGTPSVVQLCKEPVLCVCVFSQISRTSHRLTRPSCPIGRPVDRSELTSSACPSVCVCDSRRVSAVSVLLLRRSDALLLLSPPRPSCRAATLLCMRRGAIHQNVSVIVIIDAPAVATEGSMWRV